MLSFGLCMHHLCMHAGHPQGSLQHEAGSWTASHAYEPEQQQACAPDSFTGGTHRCDAGVGGFRAWLFR